MARSPKHKPEKCGACGQTTEYELALDRGTALIVLALYNAVREKGTNRVHLDKEMVADASGWPSYREMTESGHITRNMANNASRARYHGLIAFAEGGGSGEYLLTPKGARFLWGEKVPRVAVIDKTTKHKKFYLNEDEDRTTFGELMKKEQQFWELNEATLARIGCWIPGAALASPQEALAI